MVRLLNHLRQRLMRAGGVALALGLLALPAGLRAQNAVLFVRVKAAASGELISNATIQVMFEGQSLRSAQADEKGAARIGGLPAGTFNVRVQAIGYKDKTVDGVRLDIGQVRVLEVELAVAPVELEGIRVTADRVKIQRENTEFSMVVDSAAITMLPVAHDPNQLIALTPGARPGHVWGGANFQANNYQIDGLSANNPGMGGDLLKPSINWIERVDVKGLGAGAEYGGFQGGLVDVVTKSGTNKFTGNVRTSAENRALNATNLSNTETGTEVSNRYDVNAEIRGPIVRDHLFYYLSGERILQDSRALNYLPYNDSRYSPLTRNDYEDKYFGKLSWRPGPSDGFELSGGYLNQVTDNYNLSGYQAAGAGTRYTSPTVFGNFSWRHTLGSWANIEARVNRMTHDERQEPYGGDNVPGLQPFALVPPYAAYVIALVRPYGPLN
ncbi:MAG: TonB-dependent receptor [Gemmatimonadota bacterium]